MHLMFKYNIKSRGNEGNSNTWTVYKNIEKNFEDTETIDHLEFKVSISTEEKQLGNGFGMTCYGDIEYHNYPNSDKKFMVIVEEKE